MVDDCGMGLRVWSGGRDMTVLLKQRVFGDAVRVGALATAGLFLCIGVCSAGDWAGAAMCGMQQTAVLFGNPAAPHGTQDKLSAWPT